MISSSQPAVLYSLTKPECLVFGFAFGFACLFLFLHAHCCSMRGHLLNLFELLGLGMLYPVGIYLVTLKEETALRWLLGTPFIWAFSLHLPTFLLWIAIARNVQHAAALEHKQTEVDRLRAWFHANTHRVSAHEMESIIAIEAEPAPGSRIEHFNIWYNTFAYWAYNRVFAKGDPGNPIVSFPWPEWVLRSVKQAKSKLVRLQAKCVEIDQAVWRYALNNLALRKQNFIKLHQPSPAYAVVWCVGELILWAWTLVILAVLAAIRLAINCFDQMGV